ncbi:predicted protein [Staphylococcus aureus A9754]|nr:predicted protein [Staphylococcus aureus A9754]
MHDLLWDNEINFVKIAFLSHYLCMSFTHLFLSLCTYSLCLMCKKHYIINHW